MEVNNKDMFNNILDKDEEVVRVYKPVKAKLYASNFLGCTFVCLFFLLFAILGLCSPMENGEYINKLYMLIPVGACLIAYLITYIILRLYYKNIFYAYTTKRVILRSGIFGVDYKSLDMGMIGATSVNVSLLDKIMHKNTGTLAFGSTSSPMVTGSSYSNSFKFAHISAPYDTYREIKSVIDDYKKGREVK